MQNNFSVDSCVLTVIYDSKLQKFTQKRVDYPVVSSGISIESMLRYIFIEYPAIPKVYPPGTLGIIVNGYPPVSKQALQYQDVILLLSYL